MASFNKVILMGNLTRDPQVKYVPSGMAVTDLGLAVNRSWFDKQTNQRREEVDFIEVTLWGRTAEIAGEYLTKGRPVLIEGRLQLDSWEDKQSQQKRYKLRVVGESMQMLGGRPEGGGGRAPGNAQRGASNTANQGGGGSFAPQDFGAPPVGYEDAGYDSGMGGGGGGSNHNDAPSDDEVPF